MDQFSYNLSYPITTVSWDGKFVNKLPKESYLPTCQILKDVGIRELMIAGYVTVEEANFDMLEETKHLGGLLDSMGMRPAQHHGLCAMYADPETTKNQDEVIEKLKMAVDYTANMNAPVLVIHPGHVDLHFDTLEPYYDYFDKMINRLGRKDVMKLMASNLDIAGQYAGERGVKIAIENVHIFVKDISLMKDLLLESKSPNVGFCLDSGHAHYNGLNILDYLECFKDRLFTTHFHDNRGKSDEHMPPGFGTIPWIDVIQKLWEIGYANTVNFESGAWFDLPDHEGYEAAIRYWRTCEKIASEKAKNG